MSNHLLRSYRDPALPTPARRPIAWRFPAVVVLIAALLALVALTAMSLPRGAASETEADLMLVFPEQR